MLLKNGVPFRLAFGDEPDELHHVEKDAMAIVLSEMEGAEFDWNAMRFKEQKQ